MEQKEGENKIWSIFSKGRFMEKGFFLLLFLGFVFYYLVESPQESCEKLTKNFIKKNWLFHCRTWGREACQWEIPGNVRHQRKKPYGERSKSWWVVRSWGFLGILGGGRRYEDAGLEHHRSCYVAWNHHGNKSVLNTEWPGEMTRSHYSHPLHLCTADSLL